MIVNEGSVNERFLIVNFIFAALSQDGPQIFFSNKLVIFDKLFHLKNSTSQHGSWWLCGKVKKESCLK